MQKAKLSAPSPSAWVPPSTPPAPPSTVPAEAPSSARAASFSVTKSTDGTDGQIEGTVAAHAGTLGLGPLGFPSLSELAGTTKPRPKGSTASDKASTGRDQSSQAPESRASCSFVIRQFGGNALQQLCSFEASDRGCLLFPCSYSNSLLSDVASSSSQLPCSCTQSRPTMLRKSSLSCLRVVGPRTRQRTETSTRMWRLTLSQGSLSSTRRRKMCSSPVHSPERVGKQSLPVHKRHSCPALSE